MRLGLLGPAGGDVVALGRAAELLLNGARVHRAVYLGTDGALAQVVATWSKKLVDGDQDDEAAWTRALELALRGSPSRIDEFVTNERARQRLAAVEALPEAGRGSISVRIGAHVALLARDHHALAEHDVASADILLHGEGDGPAVRSVGRRWIASPGRLDARGGGLAILEARSGDVTFSMLDADGKQVEQHRLFGLVTAEALSDG